MNNPNKKRLRRTMMFLNAQKPGLIKDPYIYKADSLMLDLEDAVAENQKDVARFSLYHALKTVDYRGAERVVRINGLDTPYWRKTSAPAWPAAATPSASPRPSTPRMSAAWLLPSPRTRRLTAVPRAKSHHRRSGVCPRRHERSGDLRER